MTGVPTNLPFPFLSGSVDLILTSKLISNLISYIPLFLEFWVLEVLGVLPKIRKRLPQLNDGHLHSALGHFHHPRELLTFYSIEFAANTVLIGFGLSRIFLVGFILFDPFIQCPIKSKSGATDRFFQIQLLTVVDNELDFMGSMNLHLPILSIYCAAFTAFFIPLINF